MQPVLRWLSVAGARLIGRFGLGYSEARVAKLSVERGRHGQIIA
jgi:hypothetical protein